MVDISSENFVRNLR